jgi:hypothetical protein
MIQQQRTHTLVKLFQLPRAHVHLSNSRRVCWEMRASAQNNYLNQFLRARIKMHTHTHYKVIAIQTHILKKGVPGCELDSGSATFAILNII